MSGTQERSQQKNIMHIATSSQLKKKRQGKKIHYFHDLREVVVDFDSDVIFGIEKFRTKIGNLFWKTISFLFGYPFFWTLIGVFYSFTFRMFHVGLVLIFAGLSSLIIFPLKERYRRRRPYDKHLALNPLTTQKDFSFPSGHTYYATVSAVSLALCYGGLLAFLLALSVGVLTGTSRIYLGVHYLSDVFVAFLLGIFVALIIRLIFPLLMILHGYILLL
ncbi:MAG: phosphatase PAP2 family protein [Promethearchaeia archaeon]